MAENNLKSKDLWDDEDNGFGEFDDFEDLDNHDAEGLQGRFMIDIMYALQKMVLDMIYKWMKFLASQSEEEMEMLASKENAIKLAYEELQKISLDDEKRELYEARLKRLWDEESRLYSAEQGGIEKGKREIALKLLDMGLTLEDIAKATELSISEIEAIKRS